MDKIQRASSVARIRSDKKTVDVHVSRALLCDHASKKCHFHDNRNIIFLIPRVDGKGTLALIISPSITKVDFSGSIFPDPISEH